MKVIGIIALLLGSLLATFGWLDYMFSSFGAIGASAIQISQLANQAMVNILGGIGLILFGGVLIVMALLSEIKNQLAQNLPPSATDSASSE